MKRAWRPRGSGGLAFDLHQHLDAPDPPVDWAGPTPERFGRAAGGTILARAIVRDERSSVSIHAVDTPGGRL